MTARRSGRNRAQRRSQALRMLLSSGVVRHAAQDPPYLTDPRYAGHLRGRMSASVLARGTSVHSTERGLEPISKSIAGQDADDPHRRE